MAGRFEGLSDLEWRLFEDVFPPTPRKRGRGMPHAPFRKILNTLLDLGEASRNIGNGGRRVRRIAGCTAGKRMVSWLPCKRGFWVWPRKEE